MDSNQSKKNRGRPAIEPTKEKLEIYRELVASGKTLAEICLISEISKPTLIRIFRKHEIKSRNGQGGLRANSGRKPRQNSKTAALMYNQEKPLPSRYMANTRAMVKYNISHYRSIKTKDGALFYPEEDVACQLPTAVFGPVLARGQRITGGEEKMEGTITIKELSQLLKISRMKAHQLIKDGQIRSIKFGRCVRIPIDEYRKFLHSEKN